MKALDGKPRYNQESEEAEIGVTEEVLVGQEQVGEPVAQGTAKQRKSIFDKWSEKLKDFLDNAE